MDLFPKEIERGGERFKMSKEDSKKESREWNERADKLYRAGDYNEAVECYQQAVILDPQYFAALFSLGNTYTKLKSYKKALEYLEKAVAINPRFKYAWLNLGNSYYRLKRYEEAIKRYKKVVSIDPQYAPVYYSLGKAYLNLEQKEKAAEYYKKALSIDPSYSKAKNALLKLGVFIEPPFEAYCGKEPYLFVSYAHKDKDLVYPIIKKMNENGVRIWYDEGIPPSSNWLESIGDNLLRCHSFLVFLTPKTLESEHVKDEIHLAKEEHKNIFVIYIEKTTLPAELRLLIGRVQAIFKYKMSEEKFWKKILQELAILTE